jgi:hypothetical protein
VRTLIETAVGGEKGGSDQAGKKEGFLKKSLGFCFTFGLFGHGLRAAGKLGGC